MSEKVVISKELANLIEERLGYGFSKETMVEWHITNFFGDGGKLNAKEGNITTEDFVKAIYIGFTTPATLDTSKYDNLSEAEREKVNKELVELQDSFQNARLMTYQDGFKDGFNRTLEKLGIKVNRN